MAKKKTPIPAVEPIVPLVGRALTDKVKELSHLPRRETAKGCGYYSLSKEGKVRVNLSEFYDAVLHAKGINLEDKIGGDGRGREATYRVTVHQNGQIVIGSAYTKVMKISPGDEFDIKLGYKHIYLKAVEKEA
jgi:AbrB-like transcriptional regulator